jgi:hypothetical protein
MACPPQEYMTLFFLFNRRVILHHRVGVNFVAVGWRLYVWKIGWVDVM